MNRNHDIAVARGVRTYGNAVEISPQTHLSVSPEQSEIHRHWCVVLACFLTAVFAWGFGFYGQSVYLAELQRVRGWSNFLIAAATTTFYLAGALVVTRVHIAIDRFGPRTVLISGVL